MASPFPGMNPYIEQEEAPHGDAELDLQQVVHRIYDAAGYEDYIYEHDPQPPLSAADALWAQRFRPKPVKSPE